MKKTPNRLFYSMILALVALSFVLPFSVKAQTEIVQGEFSYMLSEGTREATITATTTTESDIVFPETIEYNGTLYSVTAIVYRGTHFISIHPTSVTGKSIRSITGPNKVANTSSETTALFVGGELLTKVDFPLLKSLKNGTFFSATQNLTAINLPALQTLEGVHFLQNSSSLTSIELPLLESIDGEYSFYELEALTTLSLPSLKSVSGNYLFSNNVSLTHLNCPELETLQGKEMFRYSRLKTVIFADKSSLSGDYFMNNSSDSLMIKGLTTIETQARMFIDSENLRYLSLPDLVSITGVMGYELPALESVDLPNLESINNSEFFSTKNNKLTTISPMPKLRIITNSILFEGVPIIALTFPGNLSVVGSSSRLILDTYPTVITVLETDDVNEIDEDFFNLVKGGRFVVPRGKAALFAKKWSLRLDATMIYSPVTLSKSTASNLYASGSILPREGVLVYNGETYENRYMLQYAMTEEECANPYVLGPNDKNFVPKLSTLFVTNYTNPVPDLEVYYADTYVNASENKNEGTLALKRFDTTNTTRIRGFSSSGVSVYRDVNLTSKGFLFRGNTAPLTELYVPHVQTFFSSSSVLDNYLEIGTGERQTSGDDGRAKFYWHPGDATHRMGFYECANTLIPEGRAYLSIPLSMVSNIRHFNLIFDRSTVTALESTKIAVMDQNEMTNGSWYTLQGVRLSSKPTQRGVYLYRGKKVVLQ